jgi:protein subunit release factor B
MRKLIIRITRKDLRIEWFSGTGAGGQYRNKHQNCVRIRHLASGAMATGQSYRERPANIREAMLNLVKSPKFKVWQNIRIDEIETGELLEDRVNKMMQPEHLRVEVKIDGKRVVEPTKEER